MRTTAEIASLPEMEGLRPMTIDDAELIISFMQDCREADRIESIPTVDQMRRQFETPGIDILNNAFVIVDGSGRIKATSAAIPLPGAGEYYIKIQSAVHPLLRGGGLMDLTVEFGLATATEWMHRTRNKASLQAGCRSDQQAHIEVYHRHGFHPVRYFHELERDLCRPIQPADTPAGMVIRPAKLSTDGEALYTTLHDAFQDHFNPVNFTQEQTMHWLSDPNIREDLILIAFSADGATGAEIEPAGVCLNALRNEYNAQNNKREGVVGSLGVRRSYRRQGLARAMLSRSLQMLKDEGMVTAMLSVDTRNPLGATHLYESVGFTHRETSIIFEYAAP